MFCKGRENQVTDSAQRAEHIVLMMSMYCVWLLLLSLCRTAIYFVICVILISIVIVIAVIVVVQRWLTSVGMQRLLLCNVAITSAGAVSL